jgi:hypothetical protein
VVPVNCQSTTRESKEGKQAVRVADCGVFDGWPDEDHEEAPWPACVAGLTYGRACDRCSGWAHSYRSWLRKDGRPVTDMASCANYVGPFKVNDRLRCPRN